MAIGRHTRAASGPLSDLCKPRSLPSSLLLLHSPLLRTLQGLLAPLSHRRGPELLLLLTATQESRAS